MKPTAKRNFVIQEGMLGMSPKSPSVQTQGKKTGKKASAGDTWRGQKEGQYEKTAGGQKKLNSISDK